MNLYYLCTTFQHISLVQVDDIFLMKRSIDKISENIISIKDDKNFQGIFCEEMDYMGQNIVLSKILGSINIFLLA